MEDICQELAALLTHDPGQRRIPTLSSAAPLLAAGARLLQAKRVTLVSGFYIGKARAWETDGPLGTLVLADALERAQVMVTICTDRGCLSIFERGARLLNLKAKILGFPPGQDVPAEILTTYQPDVLVAIERTGRAADGCYYNASGYDISQHVAHFDSMFMAAKRAQVTTIAVGDGGNELGFGARIKEAQSILGSASDIACVTAVDHLVACGVSNWGAYALAAIFSRESGIGSLIDEQMLLRMLQEMVAAGAIDGVALQSIATVDGLPIEEEKDMFKRVMRFTLGVIKTAD